MFKGEDHADTHALDEDIEEFHGKDS